VLDPLPGVAESAIGPLIVDDRLPVQDLGQMATGRGDPIGWSDLSWRSAGCLEHATRAGR
jgi:hypothetical protein